MPLFLAVCLVGINLRMSRGGRPAARYDIVRHEETSWEREPAPVSLPQSAVDQTGNRHEGDGTRVRALIPMETRCIESVGVKGEA